MAPGERARSRTAPASAAALRRVARVVGLLALLAAGCAGLGKRSAKPTAVAPPARTVDEALAAEERGDLTTAAGLLHTAVEADPQNPDLRWEYARILLEQNKLDEAHTQLEALVAQHPDDVRAYLQLAQTLFNRGRYTDADRLVGAALHYDPTCGEALMMRARLYEMRGQNDRALTTYHRVLACHPRNTAAALRIAQLQMAAGKPDLAAPLLRATREKAAHSETTTDGERRSIEWELGTAYAQLGRWKEAVPALEQGVSPAGPTAAQSYALAFARWQSGDSPGARRDLDRALQADPQYTPALTLAASLSAPTAEAVRPAAHAEGRK